MSYPEEDQELPHPEDGEAPPSLATEASGSRKGGISSSLATETPTFLETEVSGSLATKALPTVETKAPSSLATEGPSSMTTEAAPSFSTEFPSFLETHSPLSLGEGTATSPKATHDPISKGVDQEASKTSTPSKSPENSLHLQVSPTGTQGLPPHSQEEGKAEAKLPSSSEVVASVFPAQEEPDERQATREHSGHIFSKSLPNFHNTSATANALGGRTLALRSSLPGKACSVHHTFLPESRLSPGGTCPLRIGAASWLLGPTCMLGGWVGGQAERSPGRGKPFPFL